MKTGLIRNHPFDLFFMNKRLQKLQSKLKDQNLDGLLISNPFNIHYLSHFVGLAPEEREAWILILPHQAYLFTNSLYFPKAKNLKTGFTVLETTVYQSLPTYLSKFLPHPATIGFEPSSITYQEYQDLKRKLSHLHLELTLSLVESLRLYKEASEIENIQKAVLITDQAWKYIQSRIKPGQTELEIAFDLETYMRSHGADDIAWRPLIVAGGKNSANPHHITSQYKIKNGDLVLIDMGAKVNGYISDLTRIFFTTKPTPKQQKVYQAVLEANQKSESIIKLGIDTNTIDQSARKALTKYGFPENNQYPHNLGHGIGLEIHEKPSLGMYTMDKIENGMVFTIEPAIYLENEFGIRIEDSVIMENGKLEVLSQSKK